MSSKVRSLSHSFSTAEFPDPHGVKMNDQAQAAGPPEQNFGCTTSQRLIRKPNRWARHLGMLWCTFLRTEIKSCRARPEDWHGACHIRDQLSTWLAYLLLKQTRNNQRVISVRTRDTFFGISSYPPLLRCTPHPQLSPLQCLQPWLQTGKFKNVLWLYI